MQGNYFIMHVKKSSMQYNKSTSPFFSLNYFHSVLECLRDTEKKEP